MASATVTLEVEDTFTASNVSMNVPYNSSRLINVLLNTTPEGRTIVSAIGTPSDANVSASIPADGGGIRVVTPRDVDTPANSFTLSFTVKHIRTNATLTRTLTVTYVTNDFSFGGRGPLSNLPWRSGATGTAQSRDLGNQRGKPLDITMTFGARGKQDATERDGWFDIRGGDATGIALQGCLGGLKQAGDWILDKPAQFIPIITYDQWP